MKKIVPLISVSCLSLLVSSCGLFSPSEQAKETATPLENVSPPITAQQDFQPVEPNVIESSDISVLSLIPSTDPNQRRQVIQTGRTDPFAVLPVEPTVKIKKVAADSSKKEKSSDLTSSQQKTTQTSTKSSSSPLSPKVSALPDPSEARGVLVSGVIRTSQFPIAIVKAPSEPVARQVFPGSTLANGLVQVKSINTSSEIPEVVLEQYGIEVIRTVGQGP
jgi:hypothetical protein